MMNEKQREILLIAQEECAEVTQAISKTFRFGLDTVYMNQTNKQRLEEEMGDLHCMLNMMMEEGLVDRVEVLKASLKKKQKLKTWSNVYQEETV